MNIPHVGATGLIVLQPNGDRVADYRIVNSQVRALLCLIATQHAELLICVQGPVLQAVNVGTFSNNRLQLRIDDIGSSLAASKTSSFA